MARLILATGFVALTALGLAGCGPTPATTDPSASSAAQPSITPAPVASSSPGATSASPTPRPSEIPPPGADDVDRTTPDGPVEAAPLPTTAAELAEPVALSTGMVIEIVAVDAIEVTAQTPGEVDGSAVRVTVEARNESSQPQAVDSAVVTVVAADDIGIGTTAGDPSPLSGIVEPGDVVSGVYVFMLDPAADREVTVSVNYAAGEPVAVFTGKTS